MTRITIKDIAKELHLHHSTVSRALRNDARVNEITRKKVVDFAESSGYQVNMSALQLRGNTRNVIAVIVPNINHNFFSNIVSTITNKAFEHGYMVSVFQSNEKYEQEAAIINTVIQHNIAGVIASVSMETHHSDHFKKLKKFKIPLVFFDRICEDLNVSKVLVNNAEIVEEAVEMLIRNKCTKIAHITGPQKLNVFRERQKGYLNALDNSGLDYRETLFLDQAFNIDIGKNAMSELLALPYPPDGLICDSNVLLTGVLLELKRRELKVPEDISVIGFSDHPFVEAFTPGVICIVQPDTEIAICAFDLLWRIMNEDEFGKPETITVSAQIVNNYTF